MRKHPQTLFGRRLREAREANGIPQDKLGVMIGLDESCSSARISRYETGAHQPPLETAKRLAQALNLPVEVFYCESDATATLVRLAASFSAAQMAKLLSAAERISQE